MKSVLTIAGSDPSGGAGIQQDLRVFRSMGMIGLSAITALTVQNSQGVLSVHPVDAEVLKAQIEALLEDATDLGGVKIGMLGGAEQVRVVAAVLRKYRPPNVVLDPVLASTGGVPLLDEAGREALLDELMPLCDLIMPNLEEAAVLTRASTIDDESGILVAGRRLLSLGARAVLIKGGHLAGAPKDYLFQRGADNVEVISGKRIETDDTHGTGCFLSSSIAGFLRLGLPRAVRAAKASLEVSLKSPVFPGKGRGYPDAFGFDHFRADARTMIRGLYVVTDSDLRPERSHVEIVTAALAGGAKVIQLRDKTLSTAALIKVAKTVKVFCAEAGAMFIVNDRLDVALASDADGLHIGPDDISPHDARMLLRPQRILGVSVNSIAEAEAAYPFATYLGVGAIFGSATKNDAGAAIGLARIGEIKAAFPDMPLVAIGGINTSNIASVIEAGADAAAVVSAVVCAPDMIEATASLCRLIDAARTK